MEIKNGIILLISPALLSCTSLLIGYSADRAVAQSAPVPAKRALPLVAMAQAATESTTKPVPQQPDWKLAVVFKRQGDHLFYAGTMKQPDLPSVLSGMKSAPLPAPAPGVIDYEVWLAADGETRGVWYSARERLFGHLSNGQASGAYADNGTMQRLVNAAGPSTPQPSFKADVEGIASYPSPPGTLDSLVKQSDVIAVGRVAGILRHAHSPINNPSHDQHTVFVLAVEEYLKKDRSTPPPILKVLQEGGPLSWEIDDHNKGAGSINIKNPLLQVGSRYILFLKSLVTADKRNPGYITGTANGITGKIAELDEYIIGTPERGKLLLLDGQTLLPQNGGQLSLDAWSFREPPQILGVPEPEALAAIRAAVGDASTSGK